jgi:hypothetical protein
MSERVVPGRPAARVARLSVAIAALVALTAAPSSEAASPAPAAPPAAAADAMRRFVGAWDATMQVVGPPGQPPQILNGIEINATGGDGRWVTGQFRSQIAGEPFEGHALLTWDAASGKFRRLWADSMSPAFWISEGTWDPKTSTLTMWIESKNSNGEAVRWREETTFADDTRIFTMFVPGGTTVEAAAMTITYRRRADAQKIPPATGPVAEPAGPERVPLKPGLGAWSMRADDAGWGEKIEATETNTWCCGGFFLVSDVKGTIGKRPYAAHAISGYDPALRGYVRALVDTAGTTLSSEPGALDSGSGSLTFHVDRPDGRGGTVHASEVVASKPNGERTAIQTEATSGAPGKVLRTTRYRKER